MPCPKIFILILLSNSSQRTVEQIEIIQEVRLQEVAKLNGSVMSEKQRDRKNKVFSYYHYCFQLETRACQGGLISTYLFILACFFTSSQFIINQYWTAKNMSNLVPNISTQHC